MSQLYEKVMRSLLKSEISCWGTPRENMKKKTTAKQNEVHIANRRQILLIFTNLKD